jgi:hypothetical protein
MSSSDYQVYLDLTLVMARLCVLVVPNLAATLLYDSTQLAPDDDQVREISAPIALGEDTSDEWEDVIEIRRGSRASKKNVSRFTPVSTRRRLEPLKTGLDALEQQQENSATELALLRGGIAPGTVQAATQERGVVRFRLARRILSVLAYIHGLPLVEYSRRVRIIYRAAHDVPVVNRYLIHYDGLLHNYMLSLARYSPFARTWLTPLAFGDWLTPATRAVFYIIGRDPGPLLAARSAYMMTMANHGYADRVRRDISHGDLVAAGMRGADLFYRMEYYASMLEPQVQTFWEYLRGGWWASGSTTAGTEGHADLSDVDWGSAFGSVIGSEPRSSSQGTMSLGDTLRIEERPVLLSAAEEMDTWLHSEPLFIRPGVDGTLRTVTHFEDLTGIQVVRVQSPSSPPAIFERTARALEPFLPTGIDARNAMGHAMGLPQLIPLLSQQGLPGITSVPGGFPALSDGATASLSMWLDGPVGLNFIQGNADPMRWAAIAGGSILPATGFENVVFQTAQEMYRRSGVTGVFTYLVLLTTLLFRPGEMRFRITLGQRPTIRQIGNGASIKRHHRSSM